MSTNKRYYYLKLKENYFDREDIKVLESMENGYLYSNILLKLMLISLKQEGRLRFKSAIPYDEKMLATITGHDIDNIRAALVIFTQMELIERLDDGTIYMLEIQDLIEQSSTETDRKRHYRQRIAAEKTLAIANKQEGDIVPRLSQSCPTKRPPELEIELKIEKELEKEKHCISGDEKTAIERVVKAINGETNSAYRPMGATAEAILGRLREGYTAEELIQVVVVKAEQWMGDEKMEKYLRPATLFGKQKFPGYLAEYQRWEKEKA